ncbi:ParB N-terminal domain-containing protein [candidate division KSB1 bacterium]|nr:ParB N-terminal domain-containing protein [candidate division KSB1 bacterium]
MRMKINDIKIGSRIRYTAGDVDALKASIQEVGLLNPILVNEQHELISGFRRLEACRQLGWIEIEAHIIPTADDNVKMLDIEYHENVGRLNLTDDEVRNFNHTRDTLLHPPKSEHSFLSWLKKLWNIILSLFNRK